MDPQTSLQSSTTWPTSPGPTSKIPPTTSCFSSSPTVSSPTSMPPNGPSLKRPVFPCPSSSSELALKTSQQWTSWTATMNCCPSTAARLRETQSSLSRCRNSSLITAPTPGGTKKC